MNRADSSPEAIETQYFQVLKELPTQKLSTSGMFPWNEATIYTLEDEDKSQAEGVIKQKET